MRFEFYVLNYDINAKEIRPFNIFSNYLVQREVEKSVKRYLRSPKKFKYEDTFDNTVKIGFEGLCEDIRRTIAWQERSRCEYEILVGDIFEECFEKWDCYRQVVYNIPMIARECIYQCKQQYKQQRGKKNADKPDNISM